MSPLPGASAEDPLRARRTLRTGVKFFPAARPPARRVTLGPVV